MGFFDLEEKEAKQRDPKLRGLSVDLLHKQGCKLCPLNRNSFARSPHMEPVGTARPLIYMLMDKVTVDDDDANQPCAGHARRMVLRNVSQDWRKAMRWSSVTRTLADNGRDPTHLEIECCRASVVKDIEETKPVAIFGLGGIALAWALDEIRPDRWTGRHVPVQIGKHKCWFFPMFNPDEVIKMRGWSGDSETEQLFQMHMKRALSLVETLPDPVVDTREIAKENVSWVTGHKNGDLDKVLDYIDLCYDENVVGLDYETNMLRPYPKDARILTTALARKHDAFAWAVDHPDAGWRDDERATIKKAWKRFLLKSKCRKVSHHLNFELEWSGVKFGLDTMLTETWEDSEAQAFLLDERQKTLNLDFLCLQHFGLPVKDLFRMDRKDMESERVEIVCEYNGVDAKYHRKLFFKQKPLLRADNVHRAYAHAVLRSAAATMTTIKGVPVNLDVVKKFYDEHMEQRRQAEKELAKLETVKKFYNLYGYEFRPSNPHDVQKALVKIEGLTLEPTKKKKRKYAAKMDEEGNPNLSTSEKAMLKLKSKLPKAIIKWRKIDKLISTYISPVMPGSKVLFPGNLLHPVISTTKVRTWRTASEEPNIQNWPHRGPAKYIRKQITVDEDHYIVAIDYAGIQARNVGMESLDEVLIKHYWEHYDIHADWLERLQRVVGTKWRPLEDIGDPPGSPTDRNSKLFKELRSSVKNKFVFPSFFGAIGKTVSGYLGIDERKGQQLSDEFFDHFKGVHKFHRRCHEFYKENGYITGLSEHRRHAPIEINQLINAPIQADESIIVCGAWKRLVFERRPELVPNWMIHDDLSFIWPKKKFDKLLLDAVPIILKQVHDWERVLPMEIEVKIGHNWCDLKEIAKFETTRDGGWRERREKEGDWRDDYWEYKVGNEGIVGERLKK